jgi:hypothetical protein
MRVLIGGAAMDGIFCGIFMSHPNFFKLTLTWLEYSSGIDRVSMLV